jgi:CubicO group peptidase (beta-lactamase class C family)
MKKIILFIALLFLAALGCGIYYLDTALPIGNGYAAKYICSQVFIAGRDPAYVFDHEVKPTNILFSLVSPAVNYRDKNVTASGPGGRRPLTAVYREGFGCTLALDATHDELMKQAEGALPRRAPDTGAPWPRGERVETGALPREINGEALNRVVSGAFVEPGPRTMRNTQAVVVVYGNRIIAEKYARGFTPATPLLGWSMTKSVTSALVGILVRQKKLNIMKPAPVAPWRKPGDARGAITLDQLLRMSSGLEFVEVYGPLKDVTDMLYGSKSMADYAASKPLRARPGTEWNYSSGTANIIAKIVRDAAGGTLAGVDAFARANLFDKLGMRSAVMEPDASGSFVGSSYMFATPHDWARFGLLLLNDGVWEGERILPEGWVKYSTTPTPPAPMGEYGAQIWLNAGEKGNPGNRTYPSLPADMFYLSGFNDQVVAVIPSRGVVIVRMGVTHDGSWPQERFIGQVLDCIGKQPR